MTIRHEMYNNLKSRNKDEINRSRLGIYSAWVYFTLFKNRNELSLEEKLNLQKSIYHDVYYSHIFKKENTNPQIDEMIMKELCYLHKSFIDNGDTWIYKTEVFKYFRYQRNQDVIIVIVLLYLYYLGFKERCVEGKEIQKFAKTILNDNKSIIRNFYYHIDILDVVKNNFTFINNLLSNWEYMIEGEVKTLIIDKVIVDFFVFSTINKYWDKNNISELINLLVPESMFSMYSRYFSDDDLTSAKKMISEFNGIFSENNEEKEVGRLLVLKDVCNDLYKRETIKFGEDNKITAEQLESFSKYVEKTINCVVNDEFESFKFSNNDDKEVTLQNDMLIYADVLSNYYFNEETRSEYISERLINAAFRIWLNIISKHINCKPIEYSNKNKQKSLIDMVESLDVIPDMAICGREFFWDEEDEKLLSEFTSAMKKVEYPGGYNLCLIIDSKLIEFSLENVDVRYEDLTWDEIEGDCEIASNGEITYNVTNGYYIPFEKSELIKHITNTQKKMLVYADVKYRIAQQKVGAGIEITFDE